MHRVGRTCRTPDFGEEASSLPQASQADIARLKGKSVTLISQYDINLLKNIESFIGIELKKEDAVQDDNITTILKKVALAIKEAEISIEFEDKTGESSSSDRQASQRQKWKNKNKDMDKDERKQYKKAKKQKRKLARS